MPYCFPQTFLASVLRAIVFAVACVSIANAQQKQSGMLQSMGVQLAAAPAGSQPASGARTLTVTASGQGRRIALVIGNGEYLYPDNLPKLANPTHDAEDIAKALRDFGFEVIERKNQTLEGMNQTIAEFGSKIGGSEAALFYFAGHGIQVKNQNYLMPINAKVESEAVVPYQGVNVNQILDEMDNGRSSTNIVMLDACRNNPISGKFRSGKSRGLASPGAAPKGTVIVYATDPGNVAADGEGRNGLFTSGLLTAFKGKNLSLDEVLTVASAEVERASRQTQTPYVNGPKTLQRNFHFRITVESESDRVAAEKTENEKREADARESARRLVEQRELARIAAENRKMELSEREAQELARRDAERKATQRRADAEREAAKKKFSDADGKVEQGEKAQVAMLNNQLSGQTSPSRLEALIGNWRIDLEGESRVRDLTVVTYRALPGVTDKVSLDAGYGYLDSGYDYVEATFTQKDGKHQIDFVTPANNIVHVEQIDSNTFSGSFAGWGSPKSVRMTRIVVDWTDIERPFAEEDKDDGTAPTKDLVGSSNKKTPLSVPGAKTVKTLVLKKMIDSTSPPVVIDVLGGTPGTRMTIRSAIWLGADPGDARDFAAEKERFAAVLSKLTNADKSKPIVFFCWSVTCWLSYNASLKALREGYKNVYWYRGGFLSWKTAALPFVKAERFAW